METGKSNMKFENTRSNLKDDKVSGMMEKVHMDLVHLQAQLRNAYGIEPEELSSAVVDTAKMVQMVHTEGANNHINRPTEAPLMLPAPSDRPTVLSGRPRKLIHYQPLFKNSDLIALAGNPESKQSREILQNHWGIQLPVLVPLLESEGSQHFEKKKPVSGLALSKIPVNSRVTSKVPSNDSSLNKGLLSATQRGIVPKTSKFAITPQPVQILNLYPQPKDIKDITVATELDNKQIKQRESSVSFAQVPPNTRQTVATRDTGIPAPPPVSPAPAVRQVVEHRLAIQHGITRLGPDLDKLQERSAAIWPMIRSVLDKMEELLQNFAIPLAFISVEKLEPLTSQIDSGVPIQKNQLIDLVINRDEVLELLNMPGRRFLGRNGKVAASVRIQSWWRGIVERKRYQAWRASKLRTALVALHWLMNAKLARVRRMLQQSRADHLEAYRTRLAALSQAWPRMKNRRRLIIHLPSIGLHQSVRSSMGTAVSRLEHAQMGRLCEIRDPLVDTIYISPIRFSPDDNQYLTKLLGLLPAIKTGSSADAAPVDDRYAIVVPETIGRFPTHFFHNAANLKYSAKSLSRLRALIAGRDAYIVPCNVTWDDLAVAAELGLPLLGPEPDVSRVYGSKSGAHRLLVASNCELPPGQADLYSADQVAEALSRLVAGHTEYGVWLLKLDNERNSRGTAVIDLREFGPVKRLVKERARFGDEWFLGWSQEASAQKLQSEFQNKHVLNDLIKPVHSIVYENGAAFLADLPSKGAILQAAAPEGSTSIMVDALIEPDGNFQVIATGDQFTEPSRRYCRLGATMPQTSMDSLLLNERCRRIAETCRDRGVVGHVSFDMIVLPEISESLEHVQQPRSHSRPSSGKSQFEEDFDDIPEIPSNVWITGLKLGYSHQSAMMQMFLFLVEGDYSSLRHRVEATIIPEIATRRRLVQPPPKPKQRYASYAYPLRHSGLKSISRAVFFQLCRAHGIGYDVKERSGTAFLLGDNLARDELCMICIADNLPDVVSGASRNLKILNKELSSPKTTANAQTTSLMSNTKIPSYMMDLPDNFLPVAEELENILRTVFANEQIQLEQEALREAQLAEELIKKKKELTDRDIPT